MMHNESGEFLPFYETAVNPSLAKTLIPSFSDVVIPVNEFALEDPFMEVTQSATAALA